MQHSTNKGGVVAAGHQATAQAAAHVLSEGGNAFDAAVAAMLAACVAEPILASAGGGGFLMAKPADSEPVIYDFFAQTPGQKQALSAIDFYPITADFGTASQTFHIGLGSSATPGFVRGLFTIHHERCQLPLRALAESAIGLAKGGVSINSFQYLISRIVSPILQATPAAFSVNQSPSDANSLIKESEIHRQPELADFLYALSLEGEDLFYRGEVGRTLIDDCIQHGGHLRWSDLHHYAVKKRIPLDYQYRDARIFSNPSPSLGGTLIAFALSLLESESLHKLQPGSAEHLSKLAKAICLTQRVRNKTDSNLTQILKPEIRDQYANLQRSQWICARGTTQISIADRIGNLASVTLSNGEGSGYVVPGTGIMMNNMLGEEDLNPRGFHQWPLNQRIASMMAPTLILRADGGIIVTGSGGSNRIRSAILQVISNLVDFTMPLGEAIAHPRIHYEIDLLSLEPTVDQIVLKELEKSFPKQQVWHEKSLFFGGAHTVMVNSKGSITGIGDSRRGGVSVTC